jgi:hypothetical protein
MPQKELATTNTLLSNAIPLREVDTNKIKVMLSNAILEALIFIFLMFNWFLYHYLNEAE